jgi:[protein-PII] uridylyltransferase
MTQNARALSNAASGFLESMPPAYRRSFLASDIEAHARIVARRGDQLAHAETWLPRQEAPAVCVVADDGPGLLSFVTDALLVHGLNIKSAQVYCRRRPDSRLEAVDFFWLEGALAGESEGFVEDSVLSSVSQTLSELIAENHSVTRHSDQRDTIPVPRTRPTRIYFDIEALRREDLVLVAEVPDFAGLLFAISSALHGQGVRIEASEIRTEHGIAKDCFYLANASSMPIDSERLHDIQQAVRAAVLMAVARD